MNSFTHYGQFMKFIFPEPDPKDVCNLCGENVGKDNLIQGHTANICFECSDLAKEIADEKRKEMAFKQVRELGDFLESIEGGTSMYEIAEKIYDAGYRKVE
ncbi:ClpX C4-type zinc finger protein [Proteus mirabilis]|uniref:ClpX C4-type zinc finger protein n=1 Tax=Proteus mirabilis TaxID=584 RepID=UPI000F5BA54D|nr:ClpX C4-type zinc finger protein [Proteus mirabilis]MBS3837608.1 hypothetical protein [Proteus mirabilis]MDF7339109.1 hypothetical protein [Proteus mirabilis]RQW16561.1 hypothetical protein EHQ54_05785 [Proteus mirabilis]